MFLFKKSLIICSETEAVGLQEEFSYCTQFCIDQLKLIEGDGNCFMLMDSKIGLNMTIEAHCAENKTDWVGIINRETLRVFSRKLRDKKFAKIRGESSIV